MSFALAIHTLRAPRCLDRRNEEWTLQLFMMARPTILIPWSSHALAPVSESLDRNQKHYSLSLRIISRLYKKFKCLHLQDLVFIVSLSSKKTKVDVYLWHIVRTPYTSKKSCWAIHAGLKKKCTARIINNNKSVLELTSTSMWQHYKLQSMKSMDFVFCLDDIESCIIGPCWKWVMSFSVDEQKPLIPPIWLSRLVPTSPVRRSSPLRT